MNTRWSGDRTPGSESSEAASTVVPARGAAFEPPLALFVADPASASAQRLLPRRGRLLIGRAADADVVLGGPLVSRHHAELQVGAVINLRDLGSANGTFVGSERLASGAARVIEPDQSFSVGGIPLVIRRSELVPGSEPRVLFAADVPAFVRAAALAPTGWGLVRLRPNRRLEPRWVPPLLSSGLRPDDRVVLSDTSEIAVLLPSIEPADLEERSRLLVEVLRRWSIDATADHLHVQPLDSAEAAIAKIVPWLAPEREIRVNSGAVVLRDPVMQELVAMIDRVAPADVNVLVLGETGAGKEVVAALLHERSPRRSKPFLRLNCASLSESLLESELFGHERGAFTGAAGKVGLLEAADGGTVFLDEVGEIALELQARLLRAIETREILRVGSVKTRTVDVRFVAATNRDLDEAVAQGRFRRDLFYRLNAVTLHVPPLRERTSEIAALAEHFLRGACQRFGLGPLALAPEALAELRAYFWPGNVRELKNCIERAALLSRGTELSPADLRLTVPSLPDAATVPSSPPPPATTREPAPDEALKRKITEALAQCGGNQSRAAELLGMPRRTFVRKLAELGVPRPRG